MKLTVLSLLAATGLGLAACGTDKSADTTTTTPDTTAVPADPAGRMGGMANDSMSKPVGGAMADPNGPTAPHANDKEFMLSAAHSDQNEIQFSKMALAKGVPADTKMLADKMIADHMKSTAALKPVAMKTGVTLPADMDADHKAMAPMMEKLSGKAFETKYLQQMVLDHQKTANTLAAHQKMTKDAALQTWITNTLPVVEGHLSMAKKDEGMKM